jgi:Tfp pilus assembly protein PilF
MKRFCPFTSVIALLSSSVCFAESQSTAEAYLVFQAPPLPRIPAAHSIVTVHQLAHRIPARARNEQNRAFAAQHKGDSAAAIEHFKKAIHNDPEYQDAINDLGVLYLRCGNIELAAEQFSNAIAVDPHEPTPYFNLTLAYIGQSQFAAAEQTARRLVDVDRTGKGGPFLLGVSLVLQGKFTAEAERNLAGVTADYPLAELWLAVGLVEKGDLAGARHRLHQYNARGETKGADVVASLLTRMEGSAERE